MLTKQMLGNAMVPRDIVAWSGSFSGLDQGAGEYSPVESTGVFKAPPLPIVLNLFYQAALAAAPIP